MSNCPHCDHRGNVFEHMIAALETVKDLEGGLEDIPREDMVLWAEGLGAPKVDGVTCADIAEGFRSLTDELYREFCGFVEGGAWAIDPDVVEKCYQHRSAHE